MGTVALARSGIPVDGDLTGPHVVVGWLHHTPLLAIAHLIAGAAMLTAGWYAPSGETPSFLLLLTVAFALVIWIEPYALHPALGLHRAHAVTYLLVGALRIAAGVLASPRAFASRAEWSRS